MKNKPAVDCEFFARHVVATLPDHLEGRKKVLATLVALLPQSYGLRQDLLKVCETLRAHEAAQLKFVYLLESTKGGEA